MPRHIISRHTSRRHCTINGQLLFRNFVSIELIFRVCSDLKKLNFFLLTFTQKYFHRIDVTDLNKKFMFY